MTSHVPRCTMVIDGVGGKNIIDLRLYSLPFHGMANVVSNLQWDLFR